MNAHTELSDRDLLPASAASFILSLAAVVFVLSTAGGPLRPAAVAPSQTIAPAAAAAVADSQSSEADPGCGCAEACLVINQ